MKTISAIIIAIILLAASIGTGSVFAQDGANHEFPIITETTEELDESNPVCEGVMFHPVLFRIAERYDATYEELVFYFCDYEFGVGELFLMMETITRSSGEITQEEIFAMRTEEELGWGEIWQNIGLIGRGKGEDEEKGRPEAFENGNNQGAANAGDEARLNNGNKPDSPPGLDKEKNPNAPVNPPGLDKGTGHPGRGRKP